MFQPFILHVTCLWFAGTLAKPKHVGNAFTYLNLTKRLLTVTLSSGYHTFQDIYISSTFTNITMPFISITLCCSPLKQCLLLPYAFFFKSKSYTFFVFFIIFMLWMTNLFFAFKNKNCRVYHNKSSWKKNLDRWNWNSCSAIKIYFISRNLALNWIHAFFITNASFQFSLSVA